MLLTFLVLFLLLLHILLLLWFLILFFHFFRAFLILADQIFQLLPRLLFLVHCWFFYLRLRARQQLRLCPCPHYGSLLLLCHSFEPVKSLHFTKSWVRSLA